jgi:hypothetical protein
VNYALSQTSDRPPEYDPERVPAQSESLQGHSEQRGNREDQQKDHHHKNNNNHNNNKERSTEKWTAT